jgi:guanylate cyclase soluble subunit beta
LPASAILELFGQFFFEFCVESGYDRILSLLGATTKDFLENLDALHDHLSIIYPGMKAPTFRCSEREDGALILHYYSDRPGLEFIVIGLVKAVAMKLHKTEVDCKVLLSKEESNENHVQFEITEKGTYSLSTAPLALANNLLVSKDATKEKPKLRNNSTNKFFANNKLKFNSSILSRAFPFHIIFDREMRIVQCGHAITRAVPQVKNAGAKITDVFNISRPHIQFDYNSICSQIMSIFVLSTKPGVLDINFPQKMGKCSDTVSTNDEKELATRFKGQMIVIKDGIILFQCSPSVTSIDDLVR